MDEKSVANRLDTIFSDVRLNPVYLAMITRRIFGMETERAAADWWLYHNQDLEAFIRGENGAFEIRRRNAIDLSYLDG